MKFDLLDKTLNFVFSKNNTKYLLLLFIAGFILRSIIAINLPPNADEMVYATHAIDIIKSGLLQEMHGLPIWFYLTDIAYRIFGVSLFSGRFLSIFFGSLSIIILYLLSKEFFSKRVSIIAAFILAFSPFHILMSLAEQDIAMMFFILLSSYFFVRTIKEQKDNLFILSTIFFSIAILIKPIAITFFPAFLIFLIYYYKKDSKEIFSKKNINLAIKLVIIFLVMMLPILTFNYLLYKDKGIVDLQFSRFTGVAKETYISIAHTIEPFSFSKLIISADGGRPGFLKGLSTFYIYGPMTFILAIIGLFFTYRKNKIAFNFLILMFIFTFIFLSGTSLLQWHFTFALPLFSIFAANTIVFVDTKLKRYLKINRKKVLMVILILILVSSFWLIIKHSGFSGKNEVFKMMSYSKGSISEDALVVVDSRIYRGRIAWIFNDKHYIESIFLQDIFANIEQLPGQQEQIKTYFIECITDDCGWGTIANQKEFNQSTEEILGSFKDNSVEKAVITTNRDEPYFRVYEAQIMLKKSVLPLADTTHSWFFYPLRYKPKEEITLSYTTHNVFDNLLDKIAHLILYLEIIIAISSIFVIGYLSYKDYKDRGS